MFTIEETKELLDGRMSDTMRKVLAKESMQIHLSDLTTPKLMQKLVDVLLCDTGDSVYCDVLDDNLTTVGYFVKSPYSQKRNQISYTENVLCKSWHFSKDDYDASIPADTPKYLRAFVVAYLDKVLFS